jgi:hypothetical protein
MEEHTFVIPVYMDSPYLEQCIQSLLDQTIKSRIIITTSAPTLFTENMAAAYKLPYFINYTGREGIAADWNFALTSGGAKLVTIAHQDDIYEPDFTEKVTTQIKAGDKKTLLLSFTGYTEIVNGKTRKLSLNAIVKKVLLLPFLFKKNIKSKFFKKLILISGNPICCPSVTLNMRVLENFKFSGDYNYVLDWYAWYELAQLTGSFTFINEKLIRHRIHPGSETSHQLKTGLRKMEEMRLFELIWGKRLAKIISYFYLAGHKNNFSN